LLLQWLGEECNGWTNYRAKEERLRLAARELDRAVQALPKRMACEYLMILALSCRWGHQHFICWSNQACETSLLYKSATVFQRILG